jgi:hypothetical protein
MRRVLTTASGDEQSGAPATLLPEQIGVRVTDELDRPVEGFVVHWVAADGGSVEPGASTTDADGIAQTRWTLGPSVGVQRATARAEGAADVGFNATASGGEPRDDDKIIVLALTTPDGSGQTVHPDFVATAPPWTGASQYLVATPYPNGDANFENPSIYAGASAILWAPPPGVQNPIASPTGGYLSDPDAVFLADRDELRVYYRAVDAHNTIRMIASSDGVSFSKPITVTEGANHTIVSPTVVRRSATDWLMWSVNAGPGCTASKTSVEVRHSSNGIDWSAPSTVALSQPGSWVWHIDVQWIASRSEYWALYNTKTPGACTTQAVYLATSPDGVAWTTYPSPVIRAGVIPEFDDIVYRSTFAYDALSDQIDFWYSGARYISPNYVWRTAYQRRARSDVFSAIAKSSANIAASLVPRPGVPPLHVLP